MDRSGLEAEKEEIIRNRSSPAFMPPLRHAIRDNRAMRIWLGLLLVGGAAFAQTILRGTVRDLSGVPSSGVLVTAIQDETSTSSSIITDEGGAFTFTRLGPGSYWIISDRDRAPKRLRLYDGQETVIDLAVPAIPVISGHVFDLAHRPLKRAHVWLLREEYRRGCLREVVIGESETNEVGAYVFDHGVEPDRHYFVLAARRSVEQLISSPLSANGESVEVPTYYPSAIEMGLAVPITLQPGEQRGGLEITIASAPYRCIHGHVDASSFTIQESALAGTGVFSLKGKASNDGGYEACGLAPGSYIFSTLWSVKKFTVSGGDSDRLDVSSEPAHIQLQAGWAVEPPLNLGPTAEGVLRSLAELLGDASTGHLLRRLATSELASDPILKQAVFLQSRKFGEDAMIELLDTAKANSHQATVVFTNVLSGEARSVSLFVPSEIPAQLDMPAGEYVVEVNLPGPDASYAAAVTYDGSEPVGERLWLTPGTMSSLNISVSSTTCRFTATITDGQGKPIQNANVIVVPGSATSVPLIARLAVRGAAGINGEYTSPRLPPGKYRLLAISQPLRWDVPEDLDRLQAALVQGTSLDLDQRAVTNVVLHTSVIY
jgi:hypothetical protein